MILGALVYATWIRNFGTTSVLAPLWHLAMFWGFLEDSLMWRRVWDACDVGDVVSAAVQSRRALA
jgi:hypothetical protein